MRIWGVQAGPYARYEVEAEDELPQGSNYMLLCKVEKDGTLTEEEFWFGTMEDVDLFMKHFRTSIQPIDLRIT